jgi:hypothetical protein
MQLNNRKHGQKKEDEERPSEIACSRADLQGKFNGGRNEVNAAGSLKGHHDLPIEPGRRRAEVTSLKIQNDLPVGFGRRQLADLPKEFGKRRNEANSRNSDQEGRGGLASLLKTSRGEVSQECDKGDTDWAEVMRDNARKLSEKKAKDAEAIRPIQSRLLQLGEYRNESPFIGTVYPHCTWQLILFKFIGSYGYGTRRAFSQ